MRTIELEHPKLTSQSLFVNRSHTSGADLLKMIEQVVQTGDQEVRHDAQGQRWVKAFTPVSMPSDEARSSLICQKGVYLITGGCGFVGRNMVKRLFNTTEAQLIFIDDLSVGTHPDTWINATKTNYGEGFTVYNGRLLFIHADALKVMPAFGFLERSCADASSSMSLPAWAMRACCLVLRALAP